MGPTAAQRITHSGIACAKPLPSTSLVCASGLLILEQLLYGLGPCSFGVGHHSAVAKVGLKQRTAESRRVYPYIWLGLHTAMGVRRLRKATPHGASRNRVGLASRGLTDWVSHASCALPAKPQKGPCKVSKGSKSSEEALSTTMHRVCRQALHALVAHARQPMRRGTLTKLC